MRHLIVVVAGLGWKEAEKIKAPPGLKFQPTDSVFPAVTCTAQASLRTALAPKEHGMVCNGFFSRRLHRTMFWEQSADLVEGGRIWDGIRAAGRSVALLFWQQSLGETCDMVLSPAPVHKHGGGIIMGNLARPDGLAPHLERSLGTFPLHRYWGPLSSPVIGDAVAGHIVEAVEFYDCDFVFAYLPTLDYDLQRFGPGDKRCSGSFMRVEKQLKTLADFAEKKGAHLTVVGDYAISDATLGPVYPNRTLRERGLLSIRTLRGRAYADLHHSRAFAMADHEIAHVFVRDPDDVSRVHDAMIATGDYETAEIKSADSPWAHKNAGEILLTARPGAWCHYPWWSKASEAPDYATHVDIHSKPGFDPCELFFGSLLPPGTCQDATRIKGTHGRVRPIAWASNAFDCIGSFIEIGKRCIQHDSGC
jgi:predicted AlkP superfamily pyrophosphatase or phosphodiesterase